MGLRLRLRPGEMFVVNGCVIQNGERRNTVTISSFGQVLRARDILQPEDAKTPIARLYLSIQAFLIEPDDMDEVLPDLNVVAARLIARTQDLDTRQRLLEAVDHVHERDYYSALAALRPLLPPRGPRNGPDPAPDRAGRGAHGAHAEAMS
ncbi:MAG: flagellar biosynthesis repressor FlbT [Alphaproteobacteria bacterium]